MARYINADNLINELSAACMPIYEKGITGILGDNSSIADIINEQPTADVQEARHGKWENTELMYENGCTRCSECKTEYYASDLEEICGDTFPTYCPLCGARMEGDCNEH
ncbi:MAG: hypothetical protein KH055_07730 [Ruminococcus bicirculans]|uniref:hypothetical protein n=1 Tax=Ruminococcus bicirculans (ex Wegman et al. 2014) TaxID=1160721 RepID=UPI001D6BB322|nr:hypothetical protein [Ruminococcus bicirculans (ex Wegman et al. 2014)]